MKGNTGGEDATPIVRVGGIGTGILSISAMLEEYDTAVIGLILVPPTSGARGSGTTACSIGVVDTGVGSAGVGVASYNSHGESLLVVSVIVIGTIS